MRSQSETIMSLFLWQFVTFFSWQIHRGSIMYVHGGNSLNPTDQIQVSVSDGIHSVVAVIQVRNILFLLEKWYHVSTTHVSTAATARIIFSSFVVVFYLSVSFFLSIKWKKLLFLSFLFLQVDISETTQSLAPSPDPYTELAVVVEASTEVVFTRENLAYIDIDSEDDQVICCVEKTMILSIVFQNDSILGLCLKRWLFYNILFVLYKSSDVFKFYTCFWFCHLVQWSNLM